MCSLVLLAAGTVFADDGMFHYPRKMWAERRVAREHMQTCMDEKRAEHSSLRLHDDALACFGMAQERLDDATMWPMCRTLVGRLSSFEVCVDRGQVLTP